MRMKAPNGAIIDASVESVEQLLDAGFSKMAEPKPAKRVAARKRKKS